MINSKQHEHNSAAAIASYSSDWINSEWILRATTKRAIAASVQQNAMKPALIASAVFISLDVFASKNILQSSLFVCANIVVVFFCISFVL